MYALSRCCDYFFRNNWILRYATMSFPFFAIFCTLPCIEVTDVQSRINTAPIYDIDILVYLLYLAYCRVGQLLFL
jgi:hypothetical protein